MIRSTPSRCSDRLALVAVAFAIAAAPAAAHAEPDDDEREAQAASYQEAVSRGYRLFEKEQYEAARAQFEKAYQIQPRPLLLFNIASTYRREENHKTALAYYNKFLDVAPADHPQRRQAEEAIELLKEKLELEKRQGGDGAAGSTAPPTTAPSPSSPDNDSPRPGRGRMWTGAAFGVIGLGGLGYAGWQAKRSIDASNELERLDPGTEWTEEQEQLYRDGESAETRAIIGSIVGGAVVVTGATLLVIGLRKNSAAEESESSVSLTPYAAHGEAGLAVFGTF
jgi:tetratricopeptide (TPR) repeat protein